MNYSFWERMARNQVESNTRDEVSRRREQKVTEPAHAVPSRPGAAHCSSLSLATSSRKTGDPRQAGYSRETVLLGCFCLVFLLLAVTAFVSRMYHKEVHMLADHWFAKGEAAFRAGDAEEAVRDYRNALVYSTSNPVYQLHLAEALTTARKDKEARSYLLNLLAESPGNGEINLELARIAARSNDESSATDTTEDTMRYYYGAIYGVWDTNPIQMRWNARRELCEYLLAHGTISQAQPEIVALAQDVPPGDVERQKEAGALLMRVKLWNRALEEYRATLVTRKHDEDALIGAGTAAFQAGQYALAIRYLEQLPPAKRASAQISGMLDTAHEVQAANPFLPNLPNQERARRAANAVGRGQALLQECSQKKPSIANGNLQKLQDTLSQNAKVWNERGFARDPTSIDAAMTWVFQAEDTVAQLCGASQNAIDRALLLIAQSRSSLQS